MRCYDDGILRLQRESDISHRGHNRVCHWCDGSNDSYGLGYFDQSCFVIDIHHSHRFFTLQVTPYAFCLISVFGDRVFVHPHLRLVDGHLRQ